MVHVLFYLRVVTGEKKNPNAAHAYRKRRP
jgi:hypothetical protein